MGVVAEMVPGGARPVGPVRGGLVIEQSFVPGLMTATLRGVEATGAAEVRTRYFVRPGRRAIVITDLADLSGPVAGTVRLPLWPYWSGPSPALDLGVPSMRRWLYEIVLREAAGPEDLTRFLDREMLIGL
jgi:hypothetical protein